MSMEPPQPCTIRVPILPRADEVRPSESFKSDEKENHHDYTRIQCHGRIFRRFRRRLVRAEQCHRCERLEDVEGPGLSRLQRQTLPRLSRREQLVAARLLV